jgi:hypothetical protein
MIGSRLLFKQNHEIKLDDLKQKLFNCLDYYYLVYDPITLKNFIRHTRLHLTFTTRRNIVKPEDFDAWIMEWKKENKLI